MIAEQDLRNVFRFHTPFPGDGRCRLHELKKGEQFFVKEPSGEMVIIGLQYVFTALSDGFIDQNGIGTVEIAD